MLVTNESIMISRAITTVCLPNDHRTPNYTGRQYADHREGGQTSTYTVNLHNVQHAEDSD